MQPVGYSYKLKIISAGVKEVLQNKISLRLDLITQYNEEMQLTKEETVKAGVIIGRQVHRIWKKVYLSSQHDVISRQVLSVGSL